MRTVYIVDLKAGLGMLHCPSTGDISECYKKPTEVSEETGSHARGAAVKCVRQRKRREKFVDVKTVKLSEENRMHVLRCARVAPSL